MVKTIVATVIAVLLIEIVMVVVGEYSGIPDVAATTRDPGIIRWFLETTRDHAIASRARKITAPALTDSALLYIGSDHYHQLCISCHGAPGAQRSEFAEGLNPKPPNLAYSTRDLTDAEIFLAIKDGIKMTGMPGFASLRSDSTIWAMVAFVKHLQTRVPKQSGRTAE